MKRTDDLAALTGAQRAAIFVLALGDEQGGRVVALLNEDEIRDISAAMAQLGSVRADIVERLCHDFVADIGQIGSIVGNLENTERLLQRNLPTERVTDIMNEIRGPAGRTMWDKLGNVNELVLANYLKNEYPQTIAVVLSKIRSEHAAKVLSVLPEGLSNDVILRMLKMDNIQNDVLDGVEKTLRAEFMSNLAHTTRRDPHEHMADIFNSLDRQSEARFVEALEERSSDSAAKIRSLMFTFEDLARISPTGIQVLLREIEKDKLPIAMKGASQKIRELFFKNLSERAGKMLRDDIEALGPVRLRDVDEAQNIIIVQAKELAAQGKIEIASSKEEDLVY
ncbi:MAG: flagellar motor switch protein FliG [Rhodospirillales bacterium 20-60-12]|nr:MAG: flagellar motor switch protein FliG [Rhodospirillales bacterium 20-60-12]HQT68117.1 flagellar motor switch protein FliG [Acetobacteraceae bacterium]